MKTCKVCGNDSEMSARQSVCEACAKAVGLRRWRDHKTSSKRLHRNHMSLAEVARVQAMIEGGYTDRKIAEATKFARTTITAFRRRHGIAANGKGGRPAND